MTEVIFGALCPSLSEQLTEFNIDSDEMRRIEGIDHAINVLSIHGYIPPSTVDRCRKKIIKRIQVAINEAATQTNQPREQR